jgi:ankyrin repeat protein
MDNFGSSIRARDKDGSTLLHIAALSGHSETAAAFLKRGVPLHMPNKRGALGLHSAAAAGFNNVVKMLISKGTNVDIRTKVGKIKGPGSRKKGFLQFFRIFQFLTQLKIPTGIKNLGQLHRPPCSRPIGATQRR